MNFISKLIRKLLLVKEITSKDGIVHFRRYRLLQLPWFAIYIHQICRSDEDIYPHDHPWHFLSFILEGSYIESSRYYPDFILTKIEQFYSGNVITHHRQDVHKIKLVSNEVWTLVFAAGKHKDWGYRFNDNAWIGQKEYRQLKNEGKLR